MTEQQQQIADFIKTDILRRDGVQITENTPLVSSGLIDSFALVDVLGKLEKVLNMRIPPGKVQAKDMDTIHRMFETAQRVGRPKK